MDIEAATDSAGANLVTLKSIAQLTASDDNVIVGVEINSNELGYVDATHENLRYIRVEITPVAAGSYTLLVFGIDGRYEPSALTIWEQIVSAPAFELP